MTERKMRFGILLPHFGPDGGPGPLVQAAETAERLGFSSVWVRDNLFISSFIKDHGGIRENGYVLDPLITLAAISQRTQTVHLGTAVVVPHRHPLKLAHEVASLDNLSNGRVILGIGLGADRNQFNSLGIPYDKRRTLVHESVDICRAAWSQEKAAYDGEIYAFRNVTLNPQPQQAIPIWHGGENWETVEFTAQYCDGWLPSRVLFKRLEERICYIKKRRDELGLAQEEFTFGAIPLTAIADSRGEALARLQPKLLLEEARRRSNDSDLQIDDLAGFLIAGTPADIRHRVGQFLDLGVTHLVFDLRSSFSTIQQALDLLGREVVPAFRS